MSGRARRLATVLVLALASSVAIAARAEAHYPICDEEVQIFNSLKYGDFDFCRLHLRYKPGATDCLRIVVTTCNAVEPDGDRRRLRRESDGQAQRIVCPPGPPPPSCPPGYPRGGIPRN
jgi:hypothetical protein